MPFSPFFMPVRRLRERWARFRRAPSPAFLLVAGFAALILCGAGLLSLPWAHSGVAPVSFLDALFTAGSAVCVTGLSVVDAAAVFSPFGHVVIALLIELGGLGVMSFAAIGFWAIGRRLSMAHQGALEDSLLQRDAGRHMRRLTRRITRLVLMAQAAGAVFLWIFFIPAHVAEGQGVARGVGYALWSAVFHAISAFCNAGFSLYSDNLAGYARSGPVLVVVAILVTLGGLGHIVLDELWEIGRRLWRRLPARAGGVRLFSLHTRVVLLVSFLLVFGGAAGLWWLGMDLDRADFAFSDALFMSVSGRTAGFNSCRMSILPTASALVLMFLMFIGGSPGSCAGGIKTTSLALWFGWLRASLRSESEVSLGGFEIPNELAWKARMLTGLATVWVLGGTLLLAVTENAPLELILFEQISAFGTTGLSMGLTPDLSTAGRLWIILSMFVGRAGPLTIVFWMAHERPAAYRRPLGRVMVG